MSKVNMLVVNALILYILFPTLGTAETPAASEEIDIPVIVNVVDASDDSNVEEAIKKANEILDQAGINLVVVDTNTINVGDNDGDLTYDEGETAQEEGQEELDETNGDAKGLKLTIADDCWTEEPNTVGWAVHRNPVVVVEPDADANEMGRTVAHEFCHALTIDYDLYDINDINSLMYGYTGGGTVLGPNEVNEIVGEAKKRGDAHWVIPIVPGRPTMIPPGIEYSIDLHGGHVDSFFDVFVESGSIDPCDPTIAFADMREIRLFGDEPFIDGTTADLEIQLGGSYYDFPAESFFDVFIEIPFDKDTDPDDELFLNIHIWSLEDDPAIFSDATIEDIEAGSTEPVPVLIHNNFRYDGSEPILANDSLEVPIPIEFFGPGSDPFDGVIYFSVSETVTLPDGVVVDVSDELVKVQLTNRCECPGIKLSCPAGGGGGAGGCAAIGVTGCGFDGEVEIKVDGQLVQVVPAASDGSFYGEFETAYLEPGKHEIFVQEMDTGPGRSDYAKGAFLHCPAGHPSSDLDHDCDVDFVDFAYMADEWLVGTE